MVSSRMECPECQTPVLESALNQYRLTPCNGCSSLLEVEVFPALFRQNAPGQTGEVLLADGESACFYHANKKAVLPCHSCGRFLCALCDCELNGEHFCPACLEAGKTKGKIKNLENQRTLYDSIALMLAVLPLATVVFWFFTPITAPIALFMSIAYWNAPRSIIHRTKIRYVIALVFAVLQIAGWGIAIYLLFTNYHG
jgi:hypothetical protein